MLLGLQKSKGLFTDLGDNKIKVSTITFKLYGKHFIFLSFFLELFIYFINWKDRESIETFLFQSISRNVTIATFINILYLS